MYTRILKIYLAGTYLYTTMIFWPGVYKYHIGVSKLPGPRRVVVALKQVPNQNKWRTPKLRKSKLIGAPTKLSVSNGLMSPLDLKNHRTALKSISSTDPISHGVLEPFCNKFEHHLPPFGRKLAPWNQCGVRAFRPEPEA